MDEYAEEKRTEKNLIVCSGISEAETTNNKRLRSTFCIEAIQTRSIVRPLCNVSRASCWFNNRVCGWKGLSMPRLSVLSQIKAMINATLLAGHDETNEIYLMSSVWFIVAYKKIRYCVD